MRINSVSIICDLIPICSCGIAWDCLLKIHGLNDWLNDYVAKCAKFMILTHEKQRFQKEQRSFVTKEN